MANENKQERFNRLVSLFEKAIIDQIKQQHGETYHANTANLAQAAWPALAEVLDAETEPVSPVLGAAVWEAVMKTNESNFHQGLERKEKAGVLPFKVVRAKRSATSVALDYA